MYKEIVFEQAGQNYLNGNTHLDVGRFDCLM